MNETNLDTLTMEQVRAMDDDALRVLVARTLGWRVEADWYHDGCAQVVNPDGEVTADGYVLGADELAVDYLELLARDSTGVPNWPDSLDDAALLAVGQRMELQSSGVDWAARVGYWPGADGWQQADTPARAVTLAWVAWKLAERQTA